MPIIYRQRTPSFSDSDSELDNENIPPVLTDADDAIVLSDLVRTGEASRLRRRGAMRLDHGYMAQNPPRVFNPTVIVVGSPTWESEPEESQGGPGISRERIPRYTRGQPRSRRTVEESEQEIVYTIFCGGDESDSEDNYYDQPCKAYEPSVLPLHPPSSSISSSKTRYTRRPKRSNGCGAVLHMSATPRQRQGTWSAKGEASSAVVGLDACYFDKEVSSKIVRSSCGCVREGVGCAVCGNPLGTRFKACKDASDGSVGHRPKPSVPIRPEGPRYWRAHGHGRSHSAKTDTHSFTFFPNMVSSYPAYTFPEHRPSNNSSSSYSSTSTRAAAQPPQDFYVNDDTTSTYTNTVFDRIMTASPAPLSDVGEDERESSSQGGFLGADVPSYMRGPNGELNYAEIDPDGDFILDAEPPSPKMNEFMLFPER